MDGRRLIRIVLVVLASAPIPALTDEAAPGDPNRYLDAVREFADNVLKYGRDTYGPKHTPLFVDGLNIHTHAPVKWITPEGQEWVLSNFASQQNLLRTLDGLSEITGDAKYRNAAEEAVRYAIENLQSPSGLLYWGGHAGYDAQADKPCGRLVHELKGFYPYYELMWKVNPKATRRLIEAFWAGHILNWSNLNMNRHYYEMSQPLKGSWDYKYDPTPVFTVGGFSPSSTAGDLYYAGAWLSKFTGEEKPLTWAKRLACRYVETRHPNTGISARVFTVFSGTVLHANDDILRKLKPVPYTFPWQGHANRVSWESHFGYDTPSPGTMMNRVTAPWICQLMLGESLGSAGKEFIQWSLEELTAWGKVAYRRDDNTFVPMCYDGTVVEGYVCEEDSPLGLKGSKLEAVPVRITELWAYTLAYGLTEDPFMWEMARHIALANGCGDIGAHADDQPKLNLDTALADPYAIVVFLELHRWIGEEAFLRMAQRIGDNVLAHRFHKGFVSPDGQYTFTKFDAIDPLALLHLHAVLGKDQSLNVPKVWPGTSFFEEAYRSKDPVDDNQLIYSLKGTSQPTESLQEAAAEGDMEAVMSMIAQGVDTNRREDSFKKTALHRAAMSGHKEVARLLINHGARLDARDGWPGGTALHYAAEKGHEEVVDLLIAKGADVNAVGGYPAGDRPLHSAARAGYRDVVELLIASGAEVDRKNEMGQTPLDLALGRNRREVAELLVQHGATVSGFHTAVRMGSLRQIEGLVKQGVDIDAPDQWGQSPLHVAVTIRREDLAECLIGHGANIDATDKQGMTALHLAVAVMDVELVKLLIENGADVNAKPQYGRTPLFYAESIKNKEVIELLQKHGAKK
ncbi:MAG: ankyrin repeat domain-containing protein [Sedimentisphaerales bacterium]|nr:ankyrin repeat domain-containing protein [Sedimentisphaerales bacterium]